MSKFLSKVLNIYFFKSCHIFETKFSNFIQKTTFHTTSRKNINPIFLALVKPISKVFSVISGRFLRRWWKRLPEIKKNHYKTNYFKNPVYIGIPVVLISITGSAFYFSHLETTPLTNRKRFIGLSKEQLRVLSSIELKKKLEDMDSKVVKGNLQTYKRVANVVQKVINCNQDFDMMKNQLWTIYLIEDEASNAFVLPTGEIFINTGLLKIVSNDHQLAFIVTHEMAHALLNHAAEQVSRGGIVDLILLIMIATIWTLIPVDGLALLTQWICDKVMMVLLHLPYSRKLETEADDVALMLISKACYDPREGGVLWNKFDLIAQLQRHHAKKELLNSEHFNNEEVPEFLSTHPNFETRAKNLDNQINKSMKLREECKCKELPPFQQSSDIIMLQNLLKQCLSKQSDS